VRSPGARQCSTPAERGFAGPLADEYASYEPGDVEFLGDDAAILHVYARATAANGARIDVDPAMIALYVVAREAGGWQIVARQNTLVNPMNAPVTKVTGKRGTDRNGRTVKSVVNVTQMKEHGAVSEQMIDVREGDVIEFTLRGERRTAEAMLVTDGYVLLDLFDGDRPAFARLELLDEVSVFRPDLDDVVSAA